MSEKEAARCGMNAGKKASGTRVRSLAFCALSIALITVCAWVSVPLGPVPFTLQTFAIMFAVLALGPKESVGAMAGYFAIGCVGVPVFSSMRGGIGVLAGPTGGFLWGFLVGAILAVALLQALSQLTKVPGVRRTAVWALAAAIFMLVTYGIGWAQLVLLSGMSPIAAFASAIAPFIVVDVCKMAAAIAVASAVRRAVRLD